jgi:hypothetical protein
MNLPCETHRAQGQRERRAITSADVRPFAATLGDAVKHRSLPEKNLELAAEVVRGAVKMGVLFNPEFQGHVIRRKAVEAAAAVLAINLVSAEAGLADDLDAAFQSMARQRVDCVIVLGEPMFFAERRRIAALRSRRDCRPCLSPASTSKPAA